jgi:hypothetical protein
MLSECSLCAVPSSLCKFQESPGICEVTVRFVYPLESPGSSETASGQATEKFCETFRMWNITG